MLALWMWLPQIALFLDFSPLFYPSIVTRSQGYYQDQFVMFAVLESAKPSGGEWINCCIENVTMRPERVVLHQFSIQYYYSLFHQVHEEQPLRIKSKAARKSISLKYPKSTNSKSNKGKCRQVLYLNSQVLLYYCVIYHALHTHIFVITDILKNLDIQI